MQAQAANLIGIEVARRGHTQPIPYRQGGTEVDQNNQPNPPSIFNKIILFLSRRPLILSCFGTSVFSIAAMISISLEYKQSCRPDLKLWLILSFARSVVRIIMKVLIEMRVRDICMNGGNASSLMKSVEVLDVFGLVWFSVGNLLIFQGPQCADVMPAIYYTCCAYIISVYIFLFVPAILKVCFWTRPLPAAQNQAELENAILRALERSSQREQFPGQASEPGICHELTPQVISYWLAYLEENCGISESKTYAEMQARRIAAEEPPCDLAFCSICLHELAEGPEGAACLEGILPTFSPSDAAAGDIENQFSPQPDTLPLVSFPCPARHVFHSPCLISWLQAVTMNNVLATCPICRDPLPVRAPHRTRPLIAAGPPPPGPGPPRDRGPDGREREDRMRLIFMSGHDASSVTNGANSPPIATLPDEIPTPEHASP